MPAAPQVAPETQGSIAGISPGLLNRGFQVAHFLLRDRTLAIEVLKAAINKTRAQRGRETKRNYWRARFLKRRITRTTRTEEDIFQWLICMESMRYEQQQEESGNVSTRDWIIRYVKTLIQTTTAMSSFYVG